MWLKSPSCKEKCQTFGLCILLEASNSCFDSSKVFPDPSSKQNQKQSNFKVSVFTKAQSR